MANDDPDPNSRAERDLAAMLTMIEYLKMTAANLPLSAPRLLDALARASEEARRLLKRR